ncbi:uncharacterized protein [Physcomitrium patens]
MAGAMAGCGAVARSWIRGNLIGAGAFGKVNLAVNREDGEVFAVKSVRVEEGSGDAGAQVSLQALENEIEILQSLESKFVVRCLGSDWTEEGGKLMRNAYLEYMPEGCLTDFVRQFAGAGSEPLDEHLIRTYTRSIVEGVDYLHRQGIVHCDIKGKNILVGNGSVKLTDFGSAKRVGAEGRVCGNGSGGSLGRLNGTPLWMAPEVVRQDEQGLASDIWSLGCTVLEMATGKAPWSHLANPFVAMFQIGYKDEIPAVPASLSSEAQDFLRRCFERDPRKRWTSGELLEHPFLTTRHVAKKVEVEVGEAERRECDGRLVEEMKETVPILRMPSFLKRGLVTEGKVEESVGSRGYSSSPFAMPMEGEWIVVRSPSESPRSGSPSRGQRSVSTASSEPEEYTEFNIDESVEEALSVDKEVEVATVFFVKEQMSSSSSSHFFPEQCIISIDSESAVEDVMFSTGSVCTKEDFEGHDGARSERNRESGVDLLGGHGSSSALRPPAKTSEMENSGFCMDFRSLQYLIRLPQLNRFGISGLEISSSSLGVTVLKSLFFMLGPDGTDDHESRECLEGSNEDTSGTNMGNVLPWNYCTVLPRFTCNNIWKTLRVLFSTTWGFLSILLDRCAGLFVCFVLLFEEAVTFFSFNSDVITLLTLLMATMLRRFNVQHLQMPSK